MHAKRTLIRVLARAFLAGEPDVLQVVARGEHVLGRPWKWLPPLARRYVKSLGQVRPRHRDVVEFLESDRAFTNAVKRHARQISVAHWLTATPPMQPAAVAQPWEVPAIESVAALADWFWLEYGDLDWFADLKGLGFMQNSQRLHHYSYRPMLKRSGAVRLIEAPKSRLKKMQREILAGILDQVSPHPAAHGFYKGRSIQTFAAPHVGQRIVLRMDLSNFFVSISGARVQTIFRLLGYPEPVADLLGGICTNAVPRTLWDNPELPLDPSERYEVAKLYARSHLPQGAPSSPSIANLCAYRFDCRLTGLAKTVGAVYTRYADDLAFSGGTHFEKSAEVFATSVAVILQEEGFRVNHHKTRIMRQGVRQQLAGLVLNQKLNVNRADFDVLKAILTNCVRRGPQTENRSDHPAFQAHLAGRIAFFEMINPDRAKRLRALFDQISW